MNTEPPVVNQKDPLSLEEIRDIWPLLAHPDRVEAFALLPRDEAEEFFFGMKARDQAEMILGLPTREQRSWMRLLPPDDAADLVQEAPTGRREALLALLDEPTCREVMALLAYAEDDAGGLMNPRFARLRPDATVTRTQAGHFLQEEVPDALADAVVDVAARADWS